MVWTSIYKKCMLLPWPFTYNLLQGNSTLSLHIAIFFLYLGTEGNFILKWISKLLPLPLTLKNVQGLCIPSLLPTFYGSYEIKNQIIQTKSIYGLNKDFIHILYDCYMTLIFYLKKKLKKLLDHYTHFTRR